MNPKVKLSDLFALDESDSDSNDYHRKKNIIVAVQKAEDDIRYLRIRESKAQGDAKAILRAEMQTILDECLKVVARNVSNDHVLGLLLRELDSGEKKRYRKSKASSLPAFCSKRTDDCCQRLKRAKIITTPN